MADRAGAGIRDAPTTGALFAAFLRLGLTAFGGPAMIPYIEDLAVRRKGWLTRESFHSGVSVAQAVPGATAMQTVAYVGLRARGLAGAAAAYAAFGLPALCLILALSAAYGSLIVEPAGVAAFHGLKAAVVAIAVRAAILFGRNATRGWKDAAIGLAAAAWLLRGWGPGAAVAAAALAGLAIYREREVPAGEEGARGAGPDRPRILWACAVIAAAVAGAGALAWSDRRLFDLSILMTKINLLAFGGGYSSLPLLYHGVVEAKGWMAAREFMDGVALGQATPGPILITSAFVGYRLSGIAGAAVATVATFLPSFVVLVVAVPRFDRLRASPAFRKALRGVLASFSGLLVVVAIRFALAIPWTPASAGIAGAALVALFLKVEVPWVVLACAALAALFLR